MNKESSKKISEGTAHTKLLLEALRKVGRNKKENEFYYRKNIIYQRTFSRILLTEIVIIDEYYGQELYENEDPFGKDNIEEVEILKLKLQNLEEAENFLKTILSTRENIPNKAQSKKIRQEKAKLGRSGSNKSRNR